MSLPAHTIELRTLALHIRHAARRHRWSLVALSTLLLVAATCGAWRIRQTARAQLERERTRLARTDIVPFELKSHTALNRPELQIRQSTRRVRAVARLHEAYFAATDGGLLELSPTGAIARHYTVLDGLPDSDLTTLAAWGNKLFIGTRTQGLVTFDGARFNSYRWPDRQAQAITTLAADNARLLVGTFNGGLLEFDGNEFRELKAGADETRLIGLNCLVRDGARLYAGTFADGLWLADGGRWVHFTTNDGLPSNRVVGIVADHERVFVATDFGLAVAQTSSLLAAQPQAVQTGSQTFQTVASLPALAGIARFGAHTLLCADDGRLFTLADNTTRGPQLNALNLISTDAPATTLTDARLVTLDEELWLLTSDGIWRTNDKTAGTTQTQTRLAFTPFARTDAARELTSNTVSALAFDGAGRLWVGSFRDGIDLLAPDGRRLTHLDTAAAREVNALTVDGNTGAMLAATSQGLVRFDAALHATRTAAAEGLLSNAVTHVALLPTSEQQTSTSASSHHAQPGELVCATARGLSLGTQGRWRGLTTVQGLPSNSLYAVLPRGRSVFVGTLGGLAEVERGRVVRVFKDANSKLTHNWVTALCAVGARLFVGTYGGGVFELMPSGELQPVATATGALAVNPNALWSDGARLYVGTTNGAWVFELSAQRWTRLTTELPAPAVLGITGDGRHVYFGTTNGIARIAVSYFERT